MTDKVGRQRGGRESKAHSSARREVVNVEHVEDEAEVDEVAKTRKRNLRTTRGRSSARREVVNVDRIPRRSKGKRVTASTTEGEAQHAHQDEREPQPEPEPRHSDKHKLDDELELEHVEDEAEVDEEEEQSPPPPPVTGYGRFRKHVWRREKITPGKHRMEEQQQPPAGTFSGRLATLRKLKNSLGDKFVAELQPSKGLFEFLFVHDADILSPLLQNLLKYFDLEYNTFEINGHRMGITLQDVLFLCHLPINGKPVIVDLCPSDVAFRKVFGEDPPEGKEHVNTKFLTRIAGDIDRSLDQRKIATLLVIIRTVIMPSPENNRISTSFVGLLENLDSVSDYAWGAALLAFLINGIEKFLLRKKKFLDGNLWLILAFFFVRIPKLWEAIGVKNLTEPDIDSPRLLWVIKNLGRTSQNHKVNYEKVDKLLKNLADEDIEWLPYERWTLPPQLKSNVSFVCRVSPIFCNNILAHHKPHFVAKQFGYDAVKFKDNVFEFVNFKLTKKDNRGRFPHNYRKVFERELEIWEEGRCLDEFLFLRDFRHWDFRHLSSHDLDDNIDEVTASVPTRL